MSSSYFLATLLPSTHPCVPSLNGGSYLSRPLILNFTFPYPLIGLPDTHLFAGECVPEGQYNLLRRGSCGYEGKDHCALSGPRWWIAEKSVPLQEVVGARARFPKPLEAYEILKTFGSNILVTEGDIWKRQRKIAAPAFSEVRLVEVRARFESGLQQNTSRGTTGSCGTRPSISWKTCSTTYGATRTK